MNGWVWTAVVATASAGVVLCADHAAAQGLGWQARKACPAATFIQRNRAHIVRSAARNGIPATVIAGVIAAESTLNRNMADTAQDAWLAARLAFYDASWWDDWARAWSREVERVTTARWIGNKWPVSIIASGYVMSFGPAQIQPRTAIRACAQAGTTAPICSGGTKALMQALLDEVASIEVAGLVLRFEAEQWMSRARVDVRGDVAFLATLYSSGTEYVISNRGASGGKPNRMGAWVISRMRPIVLLLQGHDPDVPDEHAGVLCEATGGV